MSDDAHILYIIDDIDHHDRILERMQRIHPGVEIRVRTWKQMHDEFPERSVTGRRPLWLIVDEIAAIPDPVVAGLIAHRLAEMDFAAIEARVIAAPDVILDDFIVDLKLFSNGRYDCIRPRVTDTTHSKRRSKGERHANKRWRWS